MDEFLRKLTPLDSSHLEVFLGIFLGIFHFFNLNLNFEFVPVSYRTKPEPVRTGLTGPVTDGLVNPGMNTEYGEEIWRVCWIVPKFEKKNLSQMNS